MDSYNAMNEIELQDCPLCGGAGLLEEEGGWCLYIQCLDCGCHTAGAVELKSAATIFPELPIVLLKSFKSSHLRPTLQNKIFMLLPPVKFHRHITVHNNHLFPTIEQTAPLPFLF